MEVNTAGDVNLSKHRQNSDCMPETPRTQSIVKAGREPASQTAGRRSTNDAKIAARSRANPMPSQHHARANKQRTTDQTEPLPQQDCTTETEDEGTFFS